MSLSILWSEYFSVYIEWTEKVYRGALNQTIHMQQKTLLKSKELFLILQLKEYSIQIWVGMRASCPSQGSPTVAESEDETGYWLS